MDTIQCPSCNEGTMHRCTDLAWECDSCGYVLSDIGQRYQPIKMKKYPDLFQGMKGVQLALFATLPP